jgi:hypothetical protein
VLDEVVAHALHGVDEAHLAVAQDAQEGVDPGGVVVGREDHLLDAVEDAGVLPASGLAVEVEAVGVAADQGGIAVAVGQPVDRLGVAEGLGRELGDEVDVGRLLDQALGDPRGVFVALQLHAQGLARRDDRVAHRGILPAGHILVLEAPGGGGEAPGFEEARHVLRFVDRAAPRIGPVGLHPADRVEPESGEEFIVGLPRMILVHVITHQVMRGSRQVIGRTAVECGHKALFRGHGKGR